MKKHIFKTFYVVMLLILLAIWAEIANSPDNNNSKIYFFDVGQGDAAMIVKGDYEILIDGGPDDKVLSEIGKVMPFGDKKIELVILTHPHSDHVVGLNQVLNYYQIEKIYFSGVVHTSNQYLEFLEHLSNNKISAIIPDAGETITLFENGLVNFIWPGKKYQQINADNLNNSSLVVKYCYFSKCVLFTGDIETDEQTEMIEKTKNETLKADILKVSHHGSSNGTNQKLLEVVGPEYAIISVGADNKYGHPHNATLELIEQFGIKIFRTDRDGTIKFDLNETDILLN